MKVSHLKFNRSQIVVIFLPLVFSFGCGRAEFSFTGDTARNSQLNPPVVCAPFDPANPGTDQNGLAGSLKYLDAGQAHVSSVNDLLSTGHDAGVQLMLNQIHLPTVSFTQGFYNPQSGEALKTQSGDVLTEWFAMDLYSELLLSDSESEGFYQLALISDDGSILSVDETKSVAGTILVNNDGAHPTKMGCSSKAIYLKKNETRPIRVKYYQGPRDHIALTLMWRKVGAENSAKDSLCGSGGNGFFWNSNVVPSAPTAKYSELLSRGWKVPAAKNFILPPDVRSNPCATAI